MKKKILLLFTFLIFINCGDNQNTQQDIKSTSTNIENISWKVQVIDTFTKDDATYPSTIMDTNNIIHLTYIDSDYPLSKIKYAKYINNNWETEIVDYLFRGITKIKLINDKPYIFWYDSDYNGKSKIKYSKYYNSKWVSDTIYACNNYINPSLFDVDYNKDSDLINITFVQNNNYYLEKIQFNDSYFHHDSYPYYFNNGTKIYTFNDSLYIITTPMYGYPPYMPYGYISNDSLHIIKINDDTTYFMKDLFVDFDNKCYVLYVDYDYNNTTMTKSNLTLAYYDTSWIFDKLQDTFPFYEGAEIFSYNRTIYVCYFQFIYDHRNQLILKVKSDGIWYSKIIEDYINNENYGICIDIFNDYPIIIYCDRQKKQLKMAYKK